MKLWNRLQRVRGMQREIDEEIRSHLAMAAEERIGKGESPDEALRNARRELGNELLVKEITRDTWGWTAMERFAQDFRYAFRQTKRTPGFTAIAVLTLTLGLTATTLIFSIVNSVLLAPLPFRDPDRLYLARTVAAPGSGLAGEFPVNPRHFHEWRSRCQRCEDVALVRFDELTLVGNGEPLRLPANSVSFNFFRTLGVRPALGRDFLPGEEVDMGMGEVLLSDGLWRSRFAGDRSVVGRTIQLNGESYKIIGVLPANLHLPKGEEWSAIFGPPEAPMIFRPIGVNVARASPVGHMNYLAVVRLKAEVSPEQTTRELIALLSGFVRQSPLSIRLVSLHDQVIREAQSALWLLLAAASMVLLIVCVNIGNLMLVRTASRYREAAIRLAIGASRTQLFGLVFQEAFLYVAAGGLMALGLAAAAIRLLKASAIVSLPRVEEVRMDWHVFAFGGLAIACSTLACSLFPAWRLARIEPGESLKAGSAAATDPSRKLSLRDLMVGLEVALSTVLLIIGGLLMASFFHLMQVERGFEADHVITQDVSFLSPKYSHGGRRPVMEEMVDKLSAIPGVTSAGAVNQLPLIGEDWVGDLIDPAQPSSSSRKTAALANFRFVTPGYFWAMGIRLKQGRFLEYSDKDRLTALVSERAARYLWPKQNPLGKHVQGSGRKQPSLEVVGVVSDVPAGDLTQPPTMMVYEHFWRMEPVSMSLVLRTRTDPQRVVSAVHTILAAMDPEMAIQQTITMEQIFDDSVARRRFEMWLAVGFAVIALSLASLGIYGVISFSVARRTPEMGIRLALGARGGQLIAMVMRQGMRPVLAGITAGVVGGLSVSRLISSQLFGIAPNDPMTITLVVSLLFIVAVCACWIPARRATAIDPMLALRFE